MSETSSVKSGKKHKKSHKNGLNLVNNEQVTKPLPDSEIKHDILDIEFDSFDVGDNSRYITNIFGEMTDALNNQHLEFFYNEKFEFKFLKNTGIDNFFSMRNATSLFGGRGVIDKIDPIQGYIVNLKKKLEVALNIPKVIKGFMANIAYLDCVTDPKILITMPRYQKMKRLEGLYDTLIKFGLTLIHNYYWVDICYNKYSVDLSLKECIAKASPTIIRLKHEFESIVKEEFEYDADEEKIFMLNKKF